jgi:hypothetical protein
MESSAKLPSNEMVVVTPAMAEEWLRANKGNRKLSQGAVDTYAADMLAGAWRITHQGIGFDVDGKFIDGQHRLHAVIKAGIPVTMMVARNLPRNAQEVIDAPRLRTVKDQLHLIDGVPDPVRMAAVSKVLAVLESGRAHNEKLSLHQTREIIERYGPNMPRIISLFNNTNLKIAPFLAPLVFAMAADEARVFEFASAIREGEGLKRGDPAHTLRDFMLLGTRSHSMTERAGVTAVTLRAVYAHLHGERLEVLRPTALVGGSELMIRILTFFREANETAKR